MGGGVIWEGEGVRGAEVGGSDEGRCALGFGSVGEQHKGDLMLRSRRLRRTIRYDTLGSRC